MYVHHCLNQGAHVNTIGHAGVQVLFNDCRAQHTSSMHELPAELSTYISQMKYYERMHKVKEREQHIQEV